MGLLHIMWISFFHGSAPEGSLSFMRVGLAAGGCKWKQLEGLVYGSKYLTPKQQCYLYQQNLWPKGCVFLSIL